MDFFTQKFIKNKKYKELAILSKMYNMKIKHQHFELFNLINYIVTKSDIEWYFDHNIEDMLYFIYTTEKYNNILIRFYFQMPSIKY